MAQLCWAECKQARGFQAGRWSVHAHISPAVTELASPQSLIFSPPQSFLSLPVSLCLHSCLVCALLFLPPHCVQHTPTLFLPLTNRRRRSLRPKLAATHLEHFPAFLIGKTTKQDLYSQPTPSAKVFGFFGKSLDPSHIDVARALIPRF